MRKLLLFYICFLNGLNAAQMSDSASTSTVAPEINLTSLAQEFLSEEINTETSSLLKDIEPSVRTQNNSSLSLLVEEIFKEGYGHFLGTFHTIEAIKLVRFSHGEKLVFTYSPENKGRLWNAANNTIIWTLNQDTGLILSADFSHDNKTLLTSSADQTVKLWNTKNGHFIKCLSAIKTPQGSAQHCFNLACFSPDGLKIATVSNDYKVRIWDTESSECLQTIEELDKHIGSLHFSPDSQSFLTAGDNNDSIKLWDAKTGKCLGTFTDDDSMTLFDTKEDDTWPNNVSFGHTKGVTSVRFSPNGETFLSCSLDQTAKLWDIKKQKCVHTFLKHESPILFGDFNPNGTQIITTSNMFTSYLWDIKTGQTIIKFEGKNPSIHSAHFNNNGTSIALISGHNLRTTVHFFSLVTAALVKNCGWDLDKVKPTQLRKWIKAGNIEKAPQPSKLGIPTLYIQKFIFEKKADDIV